MDLKRLAGSILEPDGQADADEVVRRGAARVSLREFCLYTRPDYRMNWHHEVIFQYLERWIEGAIENLLLLAPPQHGKELYDDTLIITPSGWVRHGDLKPGDMVFAPSGKTVRVIAVGKPSLENCEVEFSDGSRIRCHERHEWDVYDRSRKTWKTVETLELERCCAVTNGRSRYQVANPSALDSPKLDLPVNPYVLGAWLGDGTRGAAVICYGDLKRPVFDEFVAAGYAVRRQWTHRTTGVHYAAFDRLGAALSAAGVYREKDIPASYLAASAGQRLELLAGLMDTDGSFSEQSGQFRFINTNRKLIDGVVELARSLGFRVGKVQRYEACRSSSGIQGKKDTFVVAFTATSDVPCRVAHKRPRRLRELNRRSVVAVRRVPEGLGRCIQVEGGVYLAGKTLIPTHNSEIVSRVLPSFLMGKYPDDPIMACSYGDSLAGDMNLDVQRIVDSDRYREVFPGTRLAGEGRKKGKYVRTTERLDIVGHDGVYRCAGVGGPITGKPFIYGIIDDPYKNDEEANSPLIRQRVWDWYTTTFATRKRQTGARTLLTLTPWHHLDIRGQLLSLMKSDPSADRWTVLKFPAILETESQRQPYDVRTLGEALWEERHSRKSLLSAKSKMTPAKWSALYGCDPTPAAGVIFHPENFRHFATEALPGGELHFLLYDAPAGVECEPRRVRAADCVWFQTIDPADTKGVSSSFTCVGTFARTPDGDLIVWNIWRWKLEYPKRYKAILALRDGLAAWDPAEERFAAYGFVPWPKRLAYQAIELKASGISIYQQGASDGHPFRGLKTGVQSKSERAASASILYSNRKVFHHRGAAWLSDLESELPNFPSGAFDDQGDVIAYAGVACLYDTTLGAPARGGGALILGNVGQELPQDRDGNFLLDGQSAQEQAARLAMGLSENQYVGPGGHIIDFGSDDGERRLWYDS